MKKLILIIFIFISLLLISDKAFGTTNTACTIFADVLTVDNTSNGYNLSIGILKISKPKIAPYQNQPDDICDSNTKQEIENKSVVINNTNTSEKIFAGQKIKGLVIISDNQFDYPMTDVSIVSSNIGQAQQKATNMTIWAYIISGIILATIFISAFFKFKVNSKEI